MKYLIILLLAGCAQGSGSYWYCIGACGEVKIEKAESPNKPQDFRKED